MSFSTSFSAPELYYINNGYVDDGYVDLSPLGYHVEVELTAGTLTNVTSYVSRCNFSRSIATLTDPIISDNAMVEFNDVNGVLAPLRGSLVQPGRQLKLTGEWGATTYPLFNGYITEIRNQPRIGDRQTTILNAISHINKLVQTTISTSLYRNINVSSLFVNLMALTGVNSYTADALSDTVPFVSFYNATGIAAIDALLQSGNYYLFVDGNGTVTLRAANWSFAGFDLYATDDYVAAGYLPIYDQFSDVFDMQYYLESARVINNVKATAISRVISTQVDTVAGLLAPIFVPGSSSISFWRTYQDPQRGNQLSPVASFQAQVSGTDYYAAANSDGTGADLTANLLFATTTFGDAAVCSVTNAVGTNAWLTRFQILGYVARQISDIAVETQDSSSQNVYGVQALVTKNIFQDQSYINSFATSVLSRYKNAQGRALVTIVNEFPSVLNNEIGDILGIVNSVTGVNSAWVIFGMQHDIDTIDGVRHQAQYMVRQL